MFLHLIDAVEVISSKPFGPHSPVVSLDIGILLGLVGLDVDHADPGFLRPVLEPGTDVFRAVASGARTSGALTGNSTRIASGLPRHAMIWFSTRTTRSDGSETSTSMASPSRLKSTLGTSLRDALPCNDPAHSTFGRIDHPLPGRRFATQICRKGAS